MENKVTNKQALTIFSSLYQIYFCATAQFCLNINKNRKEWNMISNIICQLEQLKIKTILWDWCILSKTTTSDINLLQFFSVNNFLHKLILVIQLKFILTIRKCRLPIPVDELGIFPKEIWVEIEEPFVIEIPLSIMFDPIEDKIAFFPWKESSTFFPFRTWCHWSTVTGNPLI